MNDVLILEDLYQKIWESYHSFRFSNDSKIPYDSEKFPNPYFEGDGYSGFEIRWDDKGAEIYGISAEGKGGLPWNNHPFPSLEAAKEHLIKTGHLR